MMNYQKVINDIKTFEELKLVKNQLLFSKNSPLFDLQQKLKVAPVAQKSTLGKKINQLKQNLEQLFNQKQQEIKQKQIQAKIDQDQNNIYAYCEQAFNYHPLFLVVHRMRKWFLANGYLETSASEIESDFYNFEQLNIDKNHPARNMQASLYLSEDLLLRTHNTGVSARLLEINNNQAFSAFTIGKVYRNDQDDQSHSHQFLQLDFVAINKSGVLNMQTLIWTLQSLLNYVFEANLKMRIRPSYFPFTEPSFEVDIFYQNRWVEVLGAGMVSEKVIGRAGYQKPSAWIAIAGGIGIERIAMIKYGINDILEFYQNDLRMLKQFRSDQFKTQFVAYDKQALIERHLTISTNRNENPLLIINKLKQVFINAIFSIKQIALFYQGDLIKRTYQIKISQAVVKDFELFLKTNNLI